MSEDYNSENILEENEPKYERFSEHNIEYHSNERETTSGEQPEKVWKTKFKATMRGFKNDIKRAAKEMKEFAKETAETIKTEADKLKKKKPKPKPVVEPVTDSTSETLKRESPTITYCPNCGYSVKPSEKRKFCPSCGTGFEV